MSNSTPIVHLVDQSPYLGGLSGSHEVKYVQLIIKTPKIEYAGTGADVFIDIGGQEMLLDKQNHDDFEQGTRDSYYLRFRGDLDDIRQSPIRIYHDNSGKKSGWYCGEVIMCISIRGENRFREYKTWPDIGWLATDVGPHYTTEAILQEKREDQEFHIENPYRNYPYYHKGQCHCHTKKSDGEDQPNVVMEAYKSKGYSFVFITDHNTCTSNPYVENILHISAGEDGCSNRHHLLNLGINKDSLDSSVDEDLDGLDDRSSSPSANLQARINYMVFQQKSISVIAHPTSSSYGSTLENLKESVGYTGVEIFNPGNAHPHWLLNSEYDNSNRTTVSWWDEALYHKKYALWGFANDDCHKVFNKDFNRGWIVVNGNRNFDKFLKQLDYIKIFEQVYQDKLDTLSDVTKANILYKAQRAYRYKALLEKDVIDNIKLGNFHSVVRSPKHPDSGHNGTEDLGPELHISVSNKQIMVTTDLASSEIRFITGSQRRSRIKDDKKIPHTVVEKGNSAKYTCTGDELYVRVEIEQKRPSGFGSGTETYIAFSQPIFIHSTKEARDNDYHSIGQ